MKMKNIGSATPHSEDIADVNEMPEERFVRGSLSIK